MHCCLKKACIYYQATCQSVVSCAHLVATVARLKVVSMVISGPAHFTFYIVRGYLQIVQSLEVDFLWCVVARSLPIDSTVIDSTALGIKICWVRFKK